MIREKFANEFYEQSIACDKQYYCELMKISEQLQEMNNLIGNAIQLLMHLKLIQADNFGSF